MLWSWVLVETAKSQTCQSNVSTIGGLIKLKNPWVLIMSVKKLGVQAPQVSAHYMYGSLQLKKYLF